MRYLVTAVGMLSLALFATTADAQRPSGRVTTQTAPAGWIGITYSPLQGAQARDGQAVIVNGVVPGSPAYESGIRPGDTIVRVNGRTDVLQQMRALSPRPGESMRLRIRRSGERDRDVTLVAAAPPPAQAFSFDRRGVVELPASPAWPGFFLSSGWLGISHPPVTPFWSDSRIESFAVTGVHPDSPAQRAGIQPGDTIVLVNGRTDAAQQMTALRLQPGDTVRLRIRRPGQRDRDVTLAAAERPGPTAFTAQIRGVPSAIVEVRPGPDGDRIMIVNGDTIRFPVDQIVRQMDTLHQRLRSYYADSIARHVRRLEREALPEAQRRLRSLDSTLVHRFPGAVILETGRRGIAGAEFSDLNPDLAAFFEGASEGVLVLRVAPESPAARSGLRAGDVVMEVNGTAIRTTPELRVAVARARGEDVTLRVVRRGRPLQLTLP